MEQFEIAPLAWRAARQPQRAPSQKLSLECSACGYGAACSAPPERCPMCQREDTWVHTPWRPFCRPA